jgi:Putative zinc-finger
MTADSRRQGCPSLELIAALAEGRLVGEERASVVAHLADCEDCREILAETVSTLRELAAEEGGGGSVSPWRARRYRWWALAAAAAVVVILVGSGYWLRRGPSAPSRAEVIAALPRATELQPLLWGGVVTRGAGGGGTIERQSAELGALLLDLDLAVAGHKADGARDLLRRMAAILETAGLLEADAESLRALAASPDVFGELGGASAERAALEERLRLRFVPFYLDLGMATEGARLAGLSHDARLWTTLELGHYFESVLRQSTEPLTPRSRELLRQLVDASDASERLMASEALLAALTS